jgi:hypothetical protein
VFSAVAQLIRKEVEGKKIEEKRHEGKIQRLKKTMEE